MFILQQDFICYTRAFRAANYSLYRFVRVASHVPISSNRSSLLHNISFMRFCRTTNLSSLLIGYRIERSEDLSVLHTFVVRQKRMNEIASGIDGQIDKLKSKGIYIESV